jgi:protocatechuate 3,4-dioxygenase beta subunit
MTRWSLVAILALTVSALTLAERPQAPPQVPGLPSGARPGAPPGAQTPGMPPPRDPRGAPQTGTAKLGGRVLSQAGEPLRRAQVTIFATEGQVRRMTTTDAEGRYEFVELPAGRFSITASKAGYVSLQFGQRRPFEPGTPVVVADGQALPAINFALPRGSVIAGRVSDEFGEPIAQAQVQAQRFQYSPDGQRRLATVQLMTSDDRGEFRLYGLMPGEYVVNAGVRNVMAITTTPNANDSSEGFAPTFYPGTINANEAQPITLGIGEEKAIQFSLAASRMARVSGTVMTSTGGPAVGAQVMLLPRTMSVPSLSTLGMVAPDGSFSGNAIPPGEYSIQVRMMPRGNAPAEFANVPLDVGSADITGIRIVTGRGATITGRVVFDGTSRRAGDVTPPRVIAQPANPTGGPTIVLATDAQNGTLDDSGHFVLGGVSGLQYLSVAGTTGWVLKSVTLAGDDVTDQPIDFSGRDAVSDVVITMTDKLTDISGVVTDARGQPVADYVVVILPSEQKESALASRYIRVVRPNNDGQFQIRGARPGRYVAAAVESLEQGRQFAPEFQQRLRQGAKEFSVREGEAVKVDLRLTPEL